jgi:ribonuclease/clavin/mitogillin
MPHLRPSAVVVPWREREGRVELYWVRRSHDVSLGGGFRAFPGGGRDDEDVALAERFATEVDCVTALRELFEETGVLALAHGLTRTGITEARRALRDGTASFTALALRHDFTFDGARLAPCGRWKTPESMPVRHDTAFFLCELGADDSPEVSPGELVDGAFVTPDEALAQWRRATALLHPPALHIVETLRELHPRDARQRLSTPPHTTDNVSERLEFQHAFRLLPVRTPTLPPATHTNTLVIGDRSLIVVDPASPYPDEQQRLGRFCDRLLREGRRFQAIVLTHEHHDHVGGVEALRAQLGIPVWAHRLTSERLPDIPVDRYLEEGERIDLGDLSLDLLHTPGHARGHLCLFEPRTRSLVAGDMVAGVGSIVIDPPEGDMHDYLASLRRLRALDVAALYPSHGPVLADGNRKLDAYIAHRLEREAQVLSAMTIGEPATPFELVPRVYADVAPKLHPLAARSLTAVLDKLVKDGRAARDEDRYTLLS